MCPFVFLCVCFLVCVLFCFSLCVFLCLGFFVCVLLFFRLCVSLFPYVALWFYEHCVLYEWLHNVCVFCMLLLESSSLYSWVFYWMIRSISCCLYYPPTGVGLSGLYLTSIAALSFTFTSHFSLVLGVMLCVSKVSHFLHEPLTELLVSTFRWDGTCQIMAACCLNGLVCGLLFGAPNNIESLALEWLFYWPSFESSNDSKGPSEVKDFKNSFVVQSILRVKEKQKDHSNKSLDGCILTNSNNLLRPPSDTQLADTPQQQRPSLPSSLQSSSISFSCSSHSSLQSYFHTETFQEFPSTFQYEAVPQKPPLQKASLQKTSILKTAPNPSKQLLCNYKQIFKCPSFFLFNASFALAYTGWSSCHLLSL